MAATVIHHTPWDRSKRLKELGLVVPDHEDQRWGLLEAVRAAVAGRAGTTGNDTRGAAGFYAWSFPTRRLREVYRALDGWQKFEENGVEGIINHVLKIKVIILSTDSGTCDPAVTPRNRTPKGSATEKLLDLNGQMSLFGPRELATQSVGYQTWELCIWDDGNEVRAELSCPVKFSGGHIIQMSERIFLIDPGEWKKIAIVPNEDGDDIVPEVRRK